MGMHRAHILLPDDLVQEIDRAVGPRGRSSFLIETARAELRRRRLLTLLNDSEPAWNRQDHPELASGAAPWVRGIRKESEGRTVTRRPASKVSAGK